MTEETPKAIAILRSNLVKEYIVQILQDKCVVEGKFYFGTSFINGKEMCTLDIYVPFKNFERHFNLGIEKEYSTILMDIILKDLLEFLANDHIGITKYYSIFGEFEVFSGVRAFNDNGSFIRLNFYGINDRSDKINNIIKEYNNACSEFALNNSEKIR